MQVGVLTVVLGGEPLKDALEYLNNIGVGTIELGCGGFIGDNHLPKEKFLDDEDSQDGLQDLFDSYGMDVSALATHNNPIHPDNKRAAHDDEELRDAIRLASQLDIDVVTCFSGLPGGAPGDETPNWITAPWPNEHSETLEYQWEEIAVPYWSEINDFADEHSVDIAIEMHPNMLIYEPTSMMRLHQETGDRIGANFDPSHLYWQGIDVTDAIRFLGGEDVIHHFHAKDTGLYESNARVKGYLDTTPYTDEPDRSWLFRSVGYGHGEQHWKEIVSTLRMVGYDGALSIEHEDSLTSGREGLEKAVDILNRAVFETTPGEAHWI